MTDIVSVNPTLAVGLRKRLLRETGEDFQAALDCLFRYVVRRGCQRAGSTHRRVVAFVKQRFAQRIVRELRAGDGRREVWSCELPGLLLHTGNTLEWLAPDVLAVPWWRVL